MPYATKMKMLQQILSRKEMIEKIFDFKNKFSIKIVQVLFAFNVFLLSLT
jgi:hypothetical protein